MPFLALIVGAMQFGSMAQTHFAEPYDGRILGIGRAPEPGIVVPAQQAYRIIYSASPSGLLMYTEKTSDSDRTLYEPYVSLNADNFSDFLGEHGRPYDPDLVTCRLHVCDAQLVDKYVIPIPDRYGRLQGEAFFPNERYVEFRNCPRHAGVLYSMDVVDLRASRVFVLYTGRDFEIGASSYASNGEHFAATLYSQQSGDQLIFLDGEVLLPFHLQDPPVGSISRKDYDRSIAEFRHWRTEDPGTPRFYGVGKNMWSEDGRYCVLGYDPYDQTKTAAAHSVGSGDGGVIVLDVESLKKAKDYRASSMMLPMPDMAKTGRFGLADKDSAVVFYSLDGQPIKRHPLPSDWRARLEATVKAGGK